MRQQNRQPFPNQTIAFWLIVAVALALRLMYLSTPFGHDESNTFTNFVNRPLLEGISHYPYPNNHLFHTLLAHISYQLLGNEPWVIRLPAFFAGVLVVPLTYLVAAHWFSTSVGLAASALAATSAQLVAYSVEARGYTLGTALFLFQVLLAEVLLERRNRLAWLLYAVAGALAVWSVPTMLYGVVPYAVWLLVSIIHRYQGAARRAHLVDLLAAGIGMGLLTVLLYLPVLMTTGPERLFANQYVTSIGLRRTLSSLPTLFAGIWNFGNLGIPELLALLLLVGFVVGALREPWRSRFRVPFSWTLAAIVPVMLLAQRVLPFDRTWLFLVPVYVIISASGLEALGSSLGRSMRGLAPAVAVVIALVSGVALVQSNWVVERISMRSAEAVVQFLEPRLQSGDFVLAAPLDRSLRYYFQKYDLPRAQVGNHLPDDFDPDGVYVVAEYYQQPEAVLIEAKSDPEYFSEPEQVQVFEDTTVYYLVPDGDR